MSSEVNKTESGQPTHYLNNKEFSQAVVDYVDACNSAKEANEAVPIVPDYIAESFLKISNKLSNRSNFSRYTYRDEMVMDAVENCLRAINNYRYDYTTRTGLPNAFSYFTQICFYAFIRRIQRENKQVDIKNAFTLNADHASFLHYGESGLDPNEFTGNIESSINTLKDRIIVVERSKNLSSASTRKLEKWEKLLLEPPKLLEQFYTKS
jgi:hypothetical protein